MLTLHEVVEMLEGAVANGVHEGRIKGVSTDSRHIQPGELFVALSGENFNGHAFLADVAARGAIAAVVSEPSDVLPTIQVADTRIALGQLARGWRRRFNIPVIAVTGSNGKTTTKEMIAAILAAAYGEDNRLATVGNLNNDIGVPLTLLHLRTHHRAAVIEIGMNHPGETSWLASVVRPTIAVVTNAQREHQEFMESVEAVAREHGLAILSLPGAGIAVYPADDEFAELWWRASGDRHVIDFALQRSDGQAFAAVMAVARPDLFDTVVHLETSVGAITARLATAGVHNVRNAAAAVAAAIAAGIDPVAIRDGLEAFAPVRGRTQRRVTAAGGLLIDDSYNANPDSVRAAIEVLATSPAPRLLILGDMGEVGEQGAAFHSEIGALAAERGIEQFMATGALMQHAVEACPGARHFESQDALIAAAQAWLIQRAAPAASVLVKGSRFMQMEKVVAALSAPLGPDANQTPEGQH